MGQSYSDAAHGDEAVDTLAVDVENQLHFVAMLVETLLRRTVRGTIHAEVFEHHGEVGPAVETALGGEAEPYLWPMSMS